MIITCQSIWSVIGCVISGIIVVWIIALFYIFRKKPEVLRVEGFLWNIFFFTCSCGGAMISFDYLRKVVFREGVFPPRPEDVLYGFLMLFSIKMWFDSLLFIRKVKADLKKKEQDSAGKS